MTLPDRTAGTDDADGPRPTTVEQLHPAHLYSTVQLLAREARPRQWVKNILVFMAPAAAGVLSHWHTTTRVTAAFLVFCIVASGTVTNFFPSKSLPAICLPAEGGG